MVRCLVVVALLLGLAVAGDRFEKLVHRGRGEDAEVRAAALAELDGILRGDDAGEAVRAAEALGRIGAPAARVLVRGLIDEDLGRDYDCESALLFLGRDAVPELAAALDRATSWGAHYRIVEVLGALGPLAEPALPSLRTAMLDGPGPIEAAKALTRIDPRAGDAVAVLMQAKGWPTQDETFCALARLGPVAKRALPWLKGLLKFAHKFDTVIAIGAIWRIGGDADWAVAELTGLLLAPGAEDTGKVCAMLAAMGPAARSAAPALLDAIEAQRPKAHGDLFEAFHEIGPGPEVSDRLHSWLRAEMAGPRAEAVWLLGCLRPPGPKAVQALLAATRDPHMVVRRTAAIALWRLEPAGDAVVPALVKMLEDPAGEDGFWAVDALKVLGARGRPATKALRGILRMDPRTLGWSPAHAAMALGFVGAAEAIPDLVDALTCGDDALERGAATGLALLGPEAAAALPALRTALADGHHALECAGAILRIEPESTDALPVLVRLLEDPEESDRALRALAEVGAAACVALPVVRPLLDDESFETRIRAIRAWWRLGGDRKVALDAVIRELILAWWMESGSRSWDAVKLLGEMGRDAAQALPLLERLRDDIQYPLGHAHDLRRSVREAIAKIRGDS